MSESPANPQRLPTARGALLLNQLGQLEQSQWWPIAEVLDNQARQLMGLLRWAATHSPHYRKAGWPSEKLAMMERRPERFWEQWRQLPVLSKTTLRSLGDTLYADTLPENHLPIDITRTSGSTGVPVEVRTTPVTRFIWDALTVREHLWQRRDFSKRLGVIRHLHAADRQPRGQDVPSWGSPVADLYATGAASVIHIGYPIEQLEEWLRRFNPHYLLTYPSIAAALLDLMDKASGKPPNLEEIRFISEPLEPELEARLAPEWRVRSSEVYSANEVGYIASRCLEQGNLHVQAESILVEILNDLGAPCAVGETGRVVVTPLHNLATPLIRYGLGDYATVGAPCACGRGLPVIQQVRGRVRNLVRTPDGRRYWPTSLGKIRSVRPIRQAQYVQSTPDTIQLRAVLERAMTDAERQQTASRVREALKYPFHVEIIAVDAIERGPTGKFEEFLSLLAD